VSNTLLVIPLLASLPIIQLQREQYPALALYGFHQGLIRLVAGYLYYMVDSFNNAFMMLLSIRN
jgi:hypothetical protein